MTDEKLLFCLAIAWNVLKIQYARIRRVAAEATRRYGDRYYRIGRHSTRAQGLLHGRRANDIVWALRNERHQPIFHRMHDDTETLVLT